MDPQRATDVHWARVRELFERVIDIAPDQRVAALIDSGATVDEREAVTTLLDADQRREPVFETTAAEWAKHLEEDPADTNTMIGQSVGPYVLKELIGEGGSSVVFRAARTIGDADQVVALKLLHHGLFSTEARRRFRREQSILTQLSHPNVARLVDGGVTEAGIPYIALEYIDGVDIISYAKTNALDCKERLRLLIQLCRAVDAAHRALVVHRDLKPSNVLVTSEGQIKVLDFGIAKLLDDNQPATFTQHLSLTPGYAAPEQYQRGSVTTSTDVYALGVIASELLVGARLGPDATHHEGSAGARGEATRRWRNLDGDVMNILRAALASEPDKRYSSAGHLADDIGRYLANQPITVSPPSRWYRARKFVARHRGGVALSAVFFASIVAGGGAALWQADVARQEAVRANTVRDFVVGLFDSARAHLPRDQRPTPDMLVEQAQRQLSQSAQLDPCTRGDILRTLGEVNLSLAKYDRAEMLFEQAREIAAANHDTASELASRVLRADAMQRAGNSADAMREVESQLALARAEPSLSLLRALGVLASAEMATGAPDAAINHRREAAVAASRIYGKDSLEALATGFEVGNTLGAAQRYPEAAATLDPLLERWRELHEPEDDRYVAALTSLATATDGLGDKPATEKNYRELLALKRRIYTAPHDEIAKSLRDLALIVARAEKYTEAESFFKEALAMQHQVYGQDHSEVAETYDAFGVVLASQRRFPESDASYRSAIAICERAQIKEELCARAHNNLGQSLYRQDRLDEAKQEMTDALTLRRALFGDAHPTVAYSLSTLANVAMKQGDNAEAVQLTSSALTTLESAGRSASREAAQIRKTHAQALKLVGRAPDALREIDRTLEVWNRVAPDGKATRVSILVLKAQIQVDLNNKEEARRTAEEAIAVGANPSDLPAISKQLLRELSGRSDFN